MIICTIDMRWDNFPSKKKKKPWVITSADVHVLSSDEIRPVHFIFLYFNVKRNRKRFTVSASAWPWPSLRRLCFKV